ncbi:MAG: MupA/Atu3671 family FMN-dependent luciferase-like monooxygenase, partial [Acidimicrobiales bacterium]
MSNRSGTVVIRSRKRRTVFVGDRALVLECADLALSGGLEVVGVISDHPAAASWAAARGIAVRSPAAGLAAAIGHFEAELLFSVGNFRVVPDESLRRFELALNFHDGPLPDLAGRNVTSWALLSGAVTHAVTWHLLTEEVDAGDIVATAEVELSADETAYSLNTKCFAAALESFPAVVTAVVRGEVVTTRQPDRPRFYRGRYDRPRSETIVDRRRTAREMARAVRALDLGARIRNPMGSVRLVAGKRFWVVGAARSLPSDSAAPVGAIALSERGLTITMADGDLLLEGLSDANGVPVPADDVFAQLDGPVAPVLDPPPDRFLAALEDQDPSMARAEASVMRRLRHVPVVEVGSVSGLGALGRRQVVVTEESHSLVEIAAAAAVWVARLTGSLVVPLEVADAPVLAVVAATAPLVRRPIAIVELPEDPDTKFEVAVRSARTALEAAMGDGPWLADLVARDPELRGRFIRGAVAIDDERGLSGCRAVTPEPSTPLHLEVADSGIVLSAATGSMSEAALERAAAQLRGVLAAVATGVGESVWRVPLIGPPDADIFEKVNDTSRDFDERDTVAMAFARQAAATPNAPAVTAGGTTLTYGDLRNRTEKLARLLAARGVRRGDLVGIALGRDEHLVPAVLAVLARGAAYVPLDPAYPTERLRLMAADAGLAAVIATQPASWLPPGVPVVDPRDQLPPLAVGLPARDAAAPATAEDLAYVIYTSGSTGRPKGVMVEHRNVINFFAAMDEVIGHDPPGVWLAVTSLSFDISILELLWTLTRGFQVVVRGDSRQGVVEAPGRSVAGSRPTFSLFYFASAEADGDVGYRLLMDGARFADRNGFEAIWTPERHFHAFGGIYPNPAITGAAIAAITERVAIRAGSVVLPLHSPITVTEDWSVVDNLSNGRVGMAMASGWQPNDFVLNPDAYADSKSRLVENIQLVRRLWAGEHVAFAGPKGDVDVQTLPRPVQDQVPLWLTTAGSAESFELAGRLGCNLLTHLLGQSIEQLTAKIASYRAARQAAGHSGEGRVTLMVHTYLDADRETAHGAAREPFKTYLASATSLLKDMASSFPTLRGGGADADEVFRSLSPSELDQLLDAAADRYLGTAGLFGSPEDAMELVVQMVTAGVDEIACLVDFGVDHDRAVAGFERIAELRNMARERFAASGSRTESEPESISSLITRHKVTHLQCTPSLATLLLADAADRAALSPLRHLFVGGEELPSTLAAELRRVMPGRITNMYGPTETTIWSLVHEIPADHDGPVPIGRPVANTKVHVLDAKGVQCPVGVLGELHIGGAGVSRGYLGRDDLTAARFVTPPGLGRCYATGDLARVDDDGLVHFHGRIDNQIKLRGHRVELGEIEAVLETHPAVVRAVARTVGTGASTLLEGYVVTRDGEAISAEALREHARSALPEAIVPSRIVVVEAFPLTPNGKIDRAALSPRLRLDRTNAAVPAPAASVSPGTGGRGTATASSQAAEDIVAAAWSEVLERSVGRDDNFFDIGGHSLLAVKVFRELCEQTAAPLALTDIFRYPTARTLGAHLAEIVFWLAPGANLGS